MNLLILFLFMLFTFPVGILYCQERPAYVLVVHGGAGNISSDNMTTDRAVAYHNSLVESLQAGELILKKGGSSMDAVEAAVRVLEDSPLFNAGKGAVFTLDGTNELDAAVMCGETLKAGAVAGVTTLRNPVTAARKVMDDSPHVMLTGKGAEQFGYEMGLEVVDPSYFFDQQRWEQYRNFLRNFRNTRGSVDQELNMGTVGAVALDMDGNLAAATSTGGMVGKRYGRVGDVPVIGAGTYANNASCAVSATGHGEYFIRFVVAHEISTRILYRQETLDSAAAGIINEVQNAGGYGGVIAVDRFGNLTMPFSSSAMFRGYVIAGDEPYTGIFNE